MSNTTTEQAVTVTMPPATMLAEALENVVTTGAEADAALLARSEAWDSFLSAVSAANAAGLSYDEQASMLNSRLGKRGIMVPTSKGIWQQRIAAGDTAVFSGPTLNNWAYYRSVADRLGVSTAMVMTVVDVSNGATRAEFDEAISNYDGDAGENGEGILAVLDGVKRAAKQRKAEQKKAKAAKAAGVTVEVVDLRSALVALLKCGDKVSELLSTTDTVDRDTFQILRRGEDLMTSLVAIATKRLPSE